MRSIDWAASARHSAARGADEFIVRERFADEAPRVVIVADRRPDMGLYPPEFPWLSKPDAVRVAAMMIADSTLAARGYLGYIDFAEGGSTPYWRAPRSQRDDWRLEPRRPFGAPRETLTMSFEHLLELRPSLLPGTFVFVVSDYLVAPDEELWLRAVEHRWDIVPVVVQDPTWERTFPDIGGAAVPILLPDGGRHGLLRLTRSEALQRRRDNEARWERLLHFFAGLDLEPVILSSSSPADVLDSFVEWSENRTYWRGSR